MSGISQRIGCQHGTTQFRHDFIDQTTLIHSHTTRIRDQRVVASRRILELNRRTVETYLIYIIMPIDKGIRIIDGVAIHIHQRNQGVGQLVQSIGSETILSLTTVWIKNIKICQDITRDIALCLDITLFRLKKHIVTIGICLDETHAVQDKAITIVHGDTFRLVIVV